MRKYFPTIIAIFILVCGLLWSIPNIKLEAGQWINIEFVLMFGICALLIRNIWLKLFMCFAIARDYAILSLMTWQTLHTVILCVVAYQLIADYRPNKTAILNTICGIALFNSAIVFMQKAGYWMFFQPVGYQNLQLASVHLTKFIFPICKYVDGGSTMYPGFFGNIDVTSAFIATVLPAFFRRKWCYFIPIMLITLCLVSALGGLAAVCMTALVWLWFNWRSSFLTAFLAFLAIGAGWITYQDDWYNIVYRGAERVPTWIAYLKLMPGHYLTGWGLGKIATFYETLRPVLGDNYTHPHNELISIFVETGIIGTFLICGFIVSLLRKATGVIRYGLIAALGCSLTIFNFHTAIGLVPLVYAALAEDCHGV